MRYDVGGPQGNVFAILGAAQRWCRQCWPDNHREQFKKLEKEAKSGDYDNALTAIENFFNGSVVFVQDGEPYLKNQQDFTGRFYPLEVDDE